MTWPIDPRPAKALLKLRAQINAAAPNRSGANEGSTALTAGMIGDAAHQSRASDHNPRDGVVLATDITHDPRHGVDTYAMSDYMITHPDRRLRHIISNKRIAGNAEFVETNKRLYNFPGVWKWAPYNGENDHTHHNHIGLVRDKRVYDQDQDWDIGPMAPKTDAPVVVAQPVLRKGSKGEAVRELQKLLGIEADGDFGAVTEYAVKAAQKGAGLVMDGVVGPYTWEAIRLPPRMPPLAPAVSPDREPLPVTPPARPSPAVADLVAASALQDVNWKNRGIAPPGYLHGMALAFREALRRYRAGDPAALAMAQKVGSVTGDAMLWLDMFRELGMRNDKDGEATLRHLFVLLIGLGMRESSGRYCEGRDRSAGNTTAETAEAGLFQASWDLRRGVPRNLLQNLLAEYASTSAMGLRAEFARGVQCTARDLEVYGTGEGATFQRLCKEKPLFAVMCAAVGLRYVRSHWGPVNRREVELRKEADDLLQQIQAMDAAS